VEIVKKEPVIANIAQLLLFIAMEFDGSNAYLEYYYTIPALMLLFLSGVLLISDLKIDNKVAYYLAISELFAVPVLYFVITRNVVFLILYIPLLLGFYYKLLKKVTLILFFGISLLFLPDRTFFGTDEILIGYYSAYLFIHHLNPYNYSLTSNVYSFYNLTYTKYLIGTPYTTGGFVTNLNYPSLFFLIEIPTVILNISPNYEILIFYLLTGVLMYLNTDELTFLLFISIYLLNYNYLFYPLGGVDDIIWVFFVLLSMTVKNARLKGVLYGLAISYKQDPLIILPFYLLHLGKERIKFLWFTGLTFLLINAYFIYLSPFLFLNDLLTPLKGGLIQIGYGIDVISITGLYYLYPVFFTIAPILILIVGLLANKRWYGVVYLSFLFFYRVLWNYLMYWPLFSYVDSFQNNKLLLLNPKKVRRLLYALTILILLILGVYFHFNFLSYQNSIHMKVIKVFEKDDYIFAFLINVSFYGEGSVLPHFRILQDSPTISANGLLWCSNSTILKTGGSEIVYVYAPYHFLYININNTKIIEINAYYSNYQGYELLNFKTCL
jgi:uncharacterized membrane protein